ncbi:hypothetical protein MLD38_011763 [Melastoma candidum]|uniref:Uncharacterized protein n=1 Tax=Melastoma candidum TaxID=119954 RepID=A0ACB9R452_9MYRT|nr:hypothetical protein MLD38_011763 [Melastoma candidum]
MEQRLGNTWRMTVNERKFIESALLSGLRIDGRDPYDYRTLSVKFGSEDGSAEVHLGQTRVLAYVTSQLVQPYRDRPNEGTLSVYTEFSPMADPSFEPGRPGETAVELGRVIDRGLRESMAIDTESLCILSGKLVWAIRIDLHIVDHGGNLIDAANVAALAALLTFRRPECTVGGENGEEVVIHPPEAREPLPLTIHHLPIAVTFALFDDEGTLVIDPTHLEEAVMGGRMTATLNTNGDVCAIQKAGGVAVPPSVIRHCLRIAATKAGDMTSKIKEAVDAYNRDRALQKIKRHPFPASVNARLAGTHMGEKQKKSEPPIHKGDGLKQMAVGISSHITKDRECKMQSTRGNSHIDGISNSFVGTPSSWDPYSKGVDTELLKLSLASQASSKPSEKQEEVQPDTRSFEAKPQAVPEETKEPSRAIQPARSHTQSKGERTLLDAVKPKNKRKKKASTMDGR